MKPLLTKLLQDRRRMVASAVCVAWLSGLLQPPAASGQGLEFEPTWQPPNYNQVRQQVFDWMDTVDVEPALAQQGRLLWPEVALRPLDNTDLLELVVATASVVDPQVTQLVADCNVAAQLPHAPQVDWLAGSTLAPFAKHNVRLYAARWFTQRAMYDEVVELLTGLEVIDVVDPASLLFCRAVAYHQLVQPDLSRAALVVLAEQQAHIPIRYRQIADLLRRDLSGLEDESLDHISRRMNDVRRRLDLGEAGKQVQVVEKGIVDSLDKIIKQIEEQQQQQSSASAGSSQSSTPMQDSQLPSMRAPGHVAPRDIGHQSGWGNLPPKEREEALQQIAREFPAHYRQLIEQYFRDLADESQPTPDR